MSDTPDKTAEKPINDGGGNAPQPTSAPTEEQVPAESQVNEESGSD